jgi:hypothetical protein
MKQAALLVAGIIFLVVAVFHLARVIFKLNAVIGNVTIPIGASIAGFVFALALALWMFSARK